MTLISLHLDRRVVRRSLHRHGRAFLHESRGQTELTWMLKMGCRICRLSMNFSNCGLQSGSLRERLRGRLRKLLAQGRTTSLLWQFFAPVMSSDALPMSSSHASARFTTAISILNIIESSVFFDNTLHKSFMVTMCCSSTPDRVVIMVKKSWPRYYHVIDTDACMLMFHDLVGVYLWPSQFSQTRSERPWERGGWRDTYVYEVPQLP